MDISTANARERAEDLLENLQKRARDWLDAEEGLIQSVREAMDENGLSPNETRRRLEDLVGRIKTNKLWERISHNDRVVALGDYRDDFERRVEDTVARVTDSLPLASKNDLAGVEKRLKSMSRTLNKLSKRIDTLETAA